LAATSEVAAAVGGSRDTIYKELQAMEGEGPVESQLAGGIRVWSFGGVGGVRSGFWTHRREAVYLSRVEDAEFGPSVAEFVL